jgi:hypothetical protein
MAMAYFNAAGSSGTSCVRKQEFSRVPGTMLNPPQQPRVACRGKRQLRSLTGDSVFCERGQRLLIAPQPLDLIQLVRAWISLRPL